MGDFERRLVELRFLEGIEKVEHVPYQTGDQFWVRFNRPLDFVKLEQTLEKHNYQLIRFGSLPSKLPRGLAEMLWDGVTHVIVNKITGWKKFTSSLGFEPEGIAKIAIDLHGPYQIFIATEEEGMQILYEYLGLKYAPPQPPQPKPLTPAKPAAAALARPAPQPAAAPRPAVPVAPVATSTPTASEPAQVKPIAQEKPAQTAGDPKAKKEAADEAPS